MLTSSPTDTGLRHTAAEEIIRPRWLAAPELSAQGCRLLFGTPLVLEHRIEASIDLTQWSMLAAGPSHSEVLEVVDGEAANLNCRCYRLSAEDVPAARIVGYLRRTLAPGFSMVANPFVNANGNTLAALLPQMPEGTSVQTFDRQTFQLRESRFVGGQWSDPLTTILPGNGVLLRNPTSEPLTVVFAGELQPDRTRSSLVAGFSICSSPLPHAGRLDHDLGFPASPGDLVHVLDHHGQDYTIHRFDVDRWVPETPVIGRGESFWVVKVAATEWTGKPSLE